MDATNKTDVAPSYFRELWEHKRLLLVGFVGLSVGYASVPYVSSVMGPRLLDAFNWSRADFAAINGLMLIIVILYPVIGRINDLIGVKRTALIGVIAMPAGFLAYSMMTGDMKQYVVIYLLHAMFCITTTAVIFTRLIVHFFTCARGLALGIVAAGPALFGAVAAPALNSYVETEGWRAGYLAMAALTAVVGGLALWALPTPKGAAAPPLARMDRTKRDYAEIFRNKAFWILAAAIFLCNLPTVAGLTQLMVMLRENGIAPANASIMLTALASGTLVGRFGCGIALDRWPVHIVSAISLGAPAIGLAVLASPYDAPAILMASVFLIGLAHGAESDLLGYAIADKFGTRVYSSVLGFMSGVMGVTSALGAIILGYTIALTDTFTLFLWIAAAATTIGALLLLLLKNTKSHGESVVD